MSGKEIGVVTHYYNKIGVAIIALSDELRVGEKIHIQGATSDFTQKVESMQVEHQAVEAAHAGQEVGVKVVERVREGDKVMVVRPETSRGEIGDKEA